MYEKCKLFYLMDGFVKIDMEVEPKLFSRVMKLVKEFRLSLQVKNFVSQEEYNQITYNFKVLNGSCFKQL